MMEKTTGLTRRGFLAGLAAMPVALSLGVGLVGCGETNGGATSGDSAAKDRADDSIDWQYIEADALVEKLENAEPMIILDIRPDDAYGKGHIPGAYHVPVFPVDTTEAEDELREAAKNLGGDDPIIVVCRSGNKGAKRTISVLQEEGIAADRLFILTGGGDGWDNADWTTTEDDSTVPGDGQAAASSEADAA